MRLRLALAALFAVAFVGWAGAADPEVVARMHWAKDYPKEVPAKPGETKGAVELFGEIEVNPGWTHKEVLFDYSPAAGGVLAEPTKLEVRDGKWGALDDKDKTKVVPFKAPMEKGKWQIRVRVQIEGKDQKGNPVTYLYQTSWRTIEIK